MWSTITKFGLSHCDFPTMMWNVTVLLRVITLNIDSRYTKRFSPLHYVVFAAFVACYFYMCVISWIWFVFWKSRQTHDVIAALIVFSLGISTQMSISKMWLMFIFNREVKKITSGYLATDALLEPGSRFAGNVLKTLKLVKRRAFWFWIIINVNGLVYTVKPLFLPGRHFPEDLWIYYGLEPMQDTPNYEIAFTISFVSSALICISASTISAFFIITIGYTEAQLLALAEEFNNLWDDVKIFNQLQVQRSKVDSTSNVSKELEERRLQNKFIKEKLANIIKKHIKNLVSFQRVEALFRIIIAVEFILLILSLISELLVGLEKIYPVMFYNLVHVGMDCFTGQRLIDASFAFETAVYNCKWENFDSSNMKTVLIILQLSQKQIHLSVGGIKMVDFSCFMSILRLVYSSYTTFQTMV